MAGRPRVHPVCTTAVERAAISRAKQRAAGQAACQVVISRRARDALDAIRSATGETGRAAVIERLAVEAEARL